MEKHEVMRTSDAALSEGIFTSQPCKFVVGQAKTEIFLHSELVKRESEPLGRIVDISFAEGQQGYVLLRDDDVATVSAFAQYLYTGNYRLPLDTPAPNGGDESYRRANHEDKARQWRRPRNSLWRRFIQSKEYKNQAHSSDSYMIPYETSCKTWPETDDIDEPYFNTEDMDKNYSELFISHAKIFVFAQYYGVEALMGLSMRRLHKALCGFGLSRERIGDILALIRYCYDRPGPEKLKKMVASYSAAIVNSQVSDVVAECFQGLLRERGDFAADMAWFLACRVTHSTEC
ncbi:hypothetical protein E4U13_006307 [Claviceps humidiphila]|uniref:BTB domain-containing protein n=1 Tax=Claviceps humidiphila TaxID=1294629 RepID=A0A9P7TUM6_9HYPO|nr:hypothetical protein E4U13_006307 [Claviceps humidiphila]